jgi:hypothetical protein
MEPEVPNLLELIVNWLTNGGYTFTFNKKNINIDLPNIDPKYTINITEDNNDINSIIILTTGVFNKEGIQKLNCLPAHKFEDSTWAIGVNVVVLSCCEPDFFERLLTILSSPPSSSTYFNILGKWDENDGK